MKIPFLTLQQQIQSLRNEIDEAVHRVLDSGRFLFGKELESFEQEFAQYCSADYCAGVASGTDALILALRALDIGPDDEVITVPNSFIATTLAIRHVGAKPVFVDVEPQGFLMNPNLIKQTITINTKAILPVHLFGQPADMHTISDISHAHNLKIIEDAAQSLGAKDQRLPLGEHSHAVAYSFYPTKNMGSFGDGGAITTKHKMVDHTVRSLRFYGMESTESSTRLGYNSRLDEIQCAILRIKLKYVESWNQRRRDMASRYINNLSSLPLTLPYPLPKRDHVYHLFVIQTPDRDALKCYLEKYGIETKIHYPIPIHLQPAMRDLGYQEGDFPVCEKAVCDSLSLPLYPELTNDTIDKISMVIKEFFNR